MKKDTFPGFRSELGLIGCLQARQTRSKAARQLQGRCCRSPSCYNAARGGFNHMSSLAGVVQQLRKEHTRAVNEVKKIAAALAAFSAAPGKGTGRRTLSEAARERIAAAQRARWAKVKGRGGRQQNIVSMPKKRTMSAAAKKKIAAAQKARWAKIKAAEKKSA